MMFSFVIISSIAATTLTTKSEQWNSIFKSKKANFAFSLENELDITVWESIFHYAINSCVYLKRQFTEVCQGYYHFLGIAFTIVLGASVLSKNSLMQLSTKSQLVRGFIPSFSGSIPPFIRFPPFQKSKMLPPFIGLSGKQK